MEPISMFRISLLLFVILFLTACGPNETEVRAALTQGLYGTDYEIIDLKFSSRYSMAKVPGDKDSRYTVKYTLVRRSRLPLFTQIELKIDADGRYVDPYQIHCKLPADVEIPREPALPSLYQNTLPAGTVMRIEGEMLMTKAPDETAFTVAVSEPSENDANAEAYLLGSTSLDPENSVLTGTPEFEEICTKLRAEL
jgi:hypothetical protein